jgi:redox-regulated HSP33 family molecular chaperone
VNDEFTVTLAGGTAVTSGAIQGADSPALFADLVAKFQAKGTSGLTFSVGTEPDIGKIIITYTANGNVVGTASFAQTKRAGAALSAGTAEVQKITLEGTLAINDEYTVTLAGGTAVTSGAIQGADSPALFADLVAKFQAKGTSGLTFSVGDEADTGKIIITYTANGNVEGTASFAQTKKAGVAIS